MTVKFQNLRIHSNWKPRFILVENTQDAASCVNFIHKDFPRYIESTERVIKHIEYLGDIIPATFLLQIHRRIFGSNTSFAPGSFRRTNVTIGDHKPPNFELVEKFMLELEQNPIKSMQDLMDWYFDFETVHPFLDGNGRVGGTVVAVYSKVLVGNYVVPDEGWSYCEHCQN